MPPPSPVRRLLAIAALVIAGEAVFGLPFHVARFFRPTLLAGLGIGNAELGGLFAAYGVLAMLSYFPGGLLADRFPARRLMCAALVLTGGGGLVLAGLPGLPVFLAVFAAFGVTTILLFWAALIRATRSWGGAGGQGRAFGALEAGRGLFAASLASLALIPLHAAFAGDPAAATHAERLLALRHVFLVYTAATFAAAALVWLCVPDDERPADVPRRERARVARVLAGPLVWLHALLVLAAYCAYKGLDNYALLVMQVEGADELAGARVGVLSAWSRPFAALAAGALADRLRPTVVAALCFAALLAGSLALALLEPGRSALLWTGVAVTCAAAFGLRGVYFAVLEETRVAPAATGAAVGLVSVIGFTPDVFFAPLTGWLLDRSPGLAGHRDVFMLLAASASLGLLASLTLRRIGPRRPVDAAGAGC